MDRRKFLTLSALSALGAPSASAASLAFGTPKPGDPQAPKVNFAYDGYMYLPDQYVNVLQQIVAEVGVAPDLHAEGGVCEEIEQKMIDWTGMEAAIYMPSGTMANNLAVRVLADDKPIVFVPERSHILQREAYSAEVLHQKKLVPLAKGQPYYGPQEFEDAVKSHRARMSYGNDIGAATMEVATRLVHQRTQPFSEMQEISRIARDNGIPLHLDGARVHSSRAYQGIDVHEYCALFDTVYMDLYKYFRAASGAVLCGSRDVIGKMKRYIKMCGGSLIFNWPSAAVANYYMDGFEDRFDRSQVVGKAVIAELNGLENISISAFDDGTNTFMLNFGALNPQEFANHLDQEHQILIRISSYDKAANNIPFKLNETLLQVSGTRVVDAFRDAELANIRKA